MAGRNITIVGFGFVGRTVASMLLMDTAQRWHINVMDPGPHVSGSVLDIAHACQLTQKHQLTLNDNALFEQAEIVVHAAGIRQPIGASRRAVVRESIALTREIFAPRTLNQEAWVIVISNPLDAIAWHTWMQSGLSAQKVIGTGALVDQIRLDYYLNQLTNLHGRQLQTVVAGEHGADFVPLWSQSTIDGLPINEVVDAPLLDEAKRLTIGAATEIRKTQGATGYGVGMATIALIRAISQSQPVLLPICVKLNEDWETLLGQKDLYLSVPAKVNCAFAQPDVLPAINAQEVEALKRAAEAVKKMHVQVG